MRNIFLLLFFFCVLSQTHAQNSPNGDIKSKPTDSSDVFSFVGEMPSFPGGDTAFASFIKKNLTYPKEAKRQNITGKVFVMFIIEKDGSVTNVSIVPGKGAHPLLDQAAMDVIKSSPKWSPGYTNDKPVRVKKIQPISFQYTK